MNSTQKIELLAPAKNLETGKAAINYGADAVYIGPPQFGARAAAGNSLADIAELARYAHQYWARTYVTLNTLLHDSELDTAVKMIWQLYDAGVDALIIQDMGLLENDLPPIRLIASTQTDNRTPEKVAFLEKVGFQRVILARELSLAEIQAIRAQTRVELEYFVHGAICVGYSGQCYLSYALGGRSGNRGNCAQPCRKIYDLQDNTGKTLLSKRHFLSLKDMNQTPNLATLLDAGITSFKIEGRLKNITYVKNITGWYRQQLDGLLNDRNMKTASSGRVIFDFQPNPDKSFNRHFTDYFFSGQQQDMSSHQTPKSMGEYLGTVGRITARGFTLNTQIPVHPGDGLCFLDKSGELQGMRVNQLDKNMIIPAEKKHLSNGVAIYRNHDHEFIKTLERSKTGRKITVDLILQETDTGFELSGTDSDGCMAMGTVNAAKIPADNPEKARQTLEQQLGKMGGSDFELGSLVFNFSQAWFLPRSEINALRRSLLENLTVVRAQAYKRPETHIQPNTVPYPKTKLDFTGNVLNQKAAEFYQRHGVKVVESAAESGLDLQNRTVMTTRYCLKKELDWCPRESVKTPAIQEPLYLVDEAGRKIRLEFNCSGTCGMRLILEK